MSKFKVGDTVYLKPIEEMDEFDQRAFMFVEDLKECQSMKIKSIQQNETNGRIEYFAQGNQKWPFYEESLESVADYLKRKAKTHKVDMGYMPAKDIDGKALMFNESLEYADVAETKAECSATREGLEFYDEEKDGYVKMSDLLKPEVEIKMELTDESMKNLMELVNGVHEEFEKKRREAIMNNTPKRVIFNSPATIVFWKDGSKTVASAHNEAYDPEKGLAVCFAKKALGNGYEGSTAFMKLVEKWLPKKDEEDDEKPKIDPAVELVEKLNQMEKDGIVLSRAKIYRFDNGSIVKYHKKIESWVHSIDKKAQNG